MQDRPPRKYTKIKYLSSSDESENEASASSKLNEKEETKVRSMAQELELMNFFNKNLALFFFIRIHKIRRSQSKLQN